MAALPLHPGVPAAAPCLCPVPMGATRPGTGLPATHAANKEVDALMAGFFFLFNEYLALLSIWTRDRALVRPLMA